MKSVPDVFVKPDVHLTYLFPMADSVMDEYTNSFQRITNNTNLVPSPHVQETEEGLVSSPRQLWLALGTSAQFQNHIHRYPDRNMRT